jgi:hypothetical protein
VADIFRAANFARRKTARTDLNDLGQSTVVTKLRKVSMQICAYNTAKNADGTQVALVATVTLPSQSNRSQPSDLLQMGVA